MKIFQRVLFVIAFTFLAIHSLRFVYQLWIEPRTSALDAYDEIVDVDIREAESLEELVDQFDAAHKAVEEYEADDSNPTVEYRDRSETEPYESEQKLRRAINSWERQSKEISRTRAYWIFGLIFLLLGGACQRV